MLLNELRQSLPVVEVGRHGRLVDGAAGVLVNNLSVDLAELVDVIMHDEALRGESDLQVFLRRRADRELQGHQRAKEIVPMEAGEPGRGSRGGGSAFTEATHGMEASSQVLHLAVGEAELVNEVFQCTLEPGGEAGVEEGTRRGGHQQPLEALQRVGLRVALPDHLDKTYGGRLNRLHGRSLTVSLLI